MEVLFAFFFFQEKEGAAGGAQPQIKYHALGGLSVGATCGRPHAMVRYRAAGLVMHRLGGAWKFFCLLFFQEKEGADWYIRFMVSASSA